MTVASKVLQCDKQVSMIRLKSKRRRAAQKRKGEGGNYVDMKELKVDKGLQIISDYVRGLYHKINSLRYDFVLDCMDIIGLCETWLCSSIPDTLVNIDKFHLIRNDREGRRGGGTCLHVNKRLSYCICDNRTQYQNFEIQAVILNGQSETIKLGL